MFSWLRKTSQDAQEPKPRSNADYVARIEADSDSKRRALGVDDALKDVPGVTTLMLVEFGENGIKTIDDLAGCATDDLVGWTEHKDNKVTKHGGILDAFAVSRQECEAMIMFARIKAGWIKESDLSPST